MHLWKMFESPQRSTFSSHSTCRGCIEESGGTAALIFGFDSSSPPASFIPGNLKFIIYFK